MLESMTLSEAADGIANADFSAAELNAAYVARIEKHNPTLNAYCHLNSEAMSEAATGGALAGLPFTLKDNMNMTGTPTACASAILNGYESPYDCTVARKLLDAGGSYLGKCNMDEFAMGSSNEHSAHGVARNPWDLARTPGGSSGGGAAAVAADLALFALGSDTGGSIRQPAAMCGVVGVKPTYGRVSRYGLVAFASSLDQIGPLTKDVSDAARVLELIMGADPADATTAVAPVPPLLPETKKEIAGLRCGLPASLDELGLDTRVAEAFSKSVDALREQGAEIVEISLPHLRYATATYYLLATAEASSNLARYDSVRFGLRERDLKNHMEMFTRTRTHGFGTEVKRRILLGTFALSSGYYDQYYKKAQKVRTLIRRDFASAFEQCDFILMPASPTPAWQLGEKLDDPIAMYLSDVFTLPASLAGLPAASVPCALLDGLPLGTQVIGNTLDEATLIRVAAALERAFPFREKRRRAVAKTLGEEAGA